MITNNELGKKKTPAWFKNPGRIDGSRQLLLLVVLPGLWAPCSVAALQSTAAPRTAATAEPS